MFKQTSITTLQQQLELIERLRNDQLNGLLKQLRNCKSKLPIEDHPIIDWGINVIGAKMREREQLIKKVIEDLHRRYDNYQSFKEELGNKNYNLKQKEGCSNLDKSFLECLDLIFDESCGVEHIGILDIFVPILRDHLKKFCGEQGMQGYADDMIKRFSTFYQNRGKESKNKFIETRDESYQKSFDHNQRISRILQSEK